MLRYGLLIAVLAYSFCMQAMPIQVGAHIQNISPHILWMTDASGDLSLQEIINLQDKFQPIGDDFFNRSASDGAIWFKFELNNTTPDTLWLMVGNAFSGNELDFYTIRPDGKTVLKLLLGSLRPPQNKAFPSPQYYVPVPHGIFTHYLREASLMPHSHQFTIGNVHATYQEINHFDFFASIFVGLLLGISAYNLFLYFSLRDTVYLIYAIERIGMLLLTTFLNSFPLLPYQWAWTFFMAWSPLTFPLQTAFTDNYLNMKEKAPTLRTWLWGFTGILGGLVPLINLSFPSSLNTLLNVTQPFIVFYYVFSIYIGIYIWKKRVKSAQFYVYAWLSSLIGISVYMMFLNDFLPYHPLIANSMYIGFGVGSVAFSLALGNRINELKTEKEIAQAEKLQYFENQHIILEKLVKERTDALQQSNEELMASEEELRLNAEELQAVNEHISEEKEKVEAALKALHEAKNKLVQSEKMASLGLLTAGVAHEINNPLNFISVGSQVLEESINSLSEVLHAYHSWENAASEEEQELMMQHLIAVKNKLGPPLELASEASAMIANIKVGVSRVTEIVHGLRSFSRSDSEKYQKASIAEILNNVLLILRNQYRDKITIVKQYDESLLPIECYPGPLNQVFMNIINNSIDAIADMGSITIATQNMGNMVRISIKDTGSGIPEELKKNIFDPFFTTKEVGKGTGLGLSIVHGIIEKHRGIIEVFSEPDKGTEFVITLPIHN